MTVAVLDREMFSEVEAARLLRVPQGTLHYWLEGGTRRGKQYQPIIRERPRDRRTVTWAEFVEAGLLRQYRRERGVPMAELRLVIDKLRAGLGVPYPLAHEQPFVGEGRQLVREIQDEVGLDPDFALVAIAREQLVLTSASASFVERVRWADGVAVAWRPHNEPKSPVVIAPDQRFGKPMVRGISTEILWEHDDAGEDLDAIAEASVSRRVTFTGRCRTRTPNGRRDGAHEARRSPVLLRRRVLGLAKVVAGLRADYTFPGDPGAVVHRRERPPCPVDDPAARDTEWIPVVARLGWLIVTRDSRIQHRRAEVDAVREAGAKMIALGGDDARGTGFRTMPRPKGHG
ncbi:MAG: hypothetical protein M3417_14015 [Actinomycetota bacterium]|nr:hypothetical protein [Actinomycetota bacterium]